MSYCVQGRLFTFDDFCEEHDDNTRLVMVLSALEAISVAVDVEA